MSASVLHSAPRRRSCHQYNISQLCWAALVLADAGVPREVQELGGTQITNSH